MRAAVFHLGVLRRLADDDRLEVITQVSTVSGGSLAIAALLALTGLRWPSSEEYRQRTYQALRQLMTVVDLVSRRAIGWRGLVDFNVGLLTDRARVLAQLLERRWNVMGTLKELPDRPTWTMNCTNVETGKNWRFSKREMGDWQFGSHYEPQISIAEAAAASAAVPYVIGALRLSLPEEGWYRTDPASGQPLDRTSPRCRWVRLWDGGAYDNLGLEELFKPGELRGCDFLICSDASGPLSSVSPWRGLLSGHLVAPRLFDITSDQIRSLRSRMLISAVVDGSIRGVLVRMGNSARDIDIKSGRLREQAWYDRFQADQDVALALKYPTDLRAMPPLMFDCIARHGYEVADLTLTTYVPKDFTASLSWA
jgi:NTE family protein